MPNQYSQPQVVNHQNTYTSQHVGLPLEQIEQALGARQNYYDQIESSGVQAKSYLGGIEGYGNWAQSRLEEKQKDLENFTSQYDNKDLTDKKISREFKQKINDISNDQEIHHIQQTGLLAKQYKSNLEEAKKSGSYTPENIYAHEKALARYSQTGDFGGEFNPAIEKGVNINEEAEKYFKALHADSADYMRKIADGEGGSIAYNNSSGGISGNKIYGQAARMLHEFQSSAAGRQAMRRYQMESEQAGNSVSQQGADQYVAKILLNAGKGFEYSESKSGLATAMDKNQDLKRAKKAKEKEETSMQGFAASEYKTADHSDLIDEQGNVKATGGIFEAANKAMVENQHKGSWESLKAGVKAAKDQLFAKKGELTPKEVQYQTELLDSFKEVNKQRKDNGLPLYSSPQQYNKAVRESSGKTQQMLMSIPFDPKLQTIYKNALETGAFRDMIAIDPQHPEDRTMTIDKMLRKQLDISDKEPLTEKLLKENGVNFVGSADGTGLSPRGFVLDLGGKRVVADNSTALGTPGNWLAPKSDKDAVDLNKYNYKQAEINVGKPHSYEAYRQYPKDHPKAGQFIKDEHGNYIPFKTKTVYDPEVKKTFGRFLK
jgi:hypothetical protein